MAHFLLIDRLYGGRDVDGIAIPDALAPWVGKDCDCPRGTDHEVTPDGE